MEQEQIIDFMKVLNNTSYLSEYDGKVIKTRLPEELKARFQTRNQWLEKGFEPKENATVYEMHPAAMNKKLCEYFLDEDVMQVDESLECCATCRMYRRRYCTLMSDHVSVNNKCSEYDKRNK